MNLNILCTFYLTPKYLRGHGKIVGEKQMEKNVNVIIDYFRNLEFFCLIKLSLCMTPTQNHT